MTVPVLHCYADYKWTGPSEPVAALCRELCERGWRSELACARAHDGHLRSLPGEARRIGLTVHDEFYFDSKPNLTRNARDVQRLSRLVEEGGFGIVHAHGTWDHVLAGLALRHRPRRAPLVRSDHRGKPYRGCLLDRLHFGPVMTDHLIVLGDRLRVRAVDRMGLAPRTVTTVRGSVDAADYHPLDCAPGTRERCGLSSEDVVFGVVSRVQRHRRFDVLLQAASLIKERDRRVKIAVLGRGTNKKAILDGPIERMGLQDTVYPLGYRVDDYRQVLAMFDAGVMLVPGSDGSCRAAMQMAAMGKPLVVAERGVLPDIVLDGETGLVVNDTPENLAEAILETAQSAERRCEWGRAARQRMEEHFSLQRQAEAVISVYQGLLAGDAAPRGSA